MAVSGKDFMQGLQMILQDRKEDRRFKLQQSLSMLQFAQTKKLQDIQITGESLKLAKAANSEMKGKVALRWLSLTGLGAVYSGGDKEDRADSINTAAGLLEDKKFSPTDAKRIAIAVWSHYELNKSDPILSIATELGGILDKDPKDLTKSQSRFFAPFTTLGLTGDEMYKTTQSASQIQRNEFLIDQEMMQFTKKDYEIQSDIKLLDESQISMPKSIPESQFALTDDDMEDQAEMSGLYSENISDILKDLETLKTDLKTKKSNLRTLSNEIRAAKGLQSKGISLSPTQSALIMDEEESLDMIENEIRVLNEEIASKREKGISLTTLNREEAIRSGQVEMYPTITHFNIPTMQKFGIWNQTGIWPSDELLEVAKAIQEKKREKEWTRMSDF